MKRQVTISMIICCFFVLGSVSAYAQNEKEQHEKQLQVMKEEAAKKEQEMLEQEKLLKELKEARVSVGVHADEVERAVRDARVAYRGWSSDEPMIITSGDAPNIYFYGGSQNSTSLQYSKNVNEATFTKDLSFEVEEGAKRASIDVSGSCKEGEIRIKITMPNGKTYTEVLIDEYGSVNWSKSFTIEEEDGSKVGDWKFLVSAKDATGTFRLSLRSN